MKCSSPLVLDKGEGEQGRRKEDEEEDGLVADVLPLVQPLQGVVLKQLHRRRGKKG